MKKNLFFYSLIFLFVFLFKTPNYCDWVKENNRYKYLNGATGQFVVNNWMQTGNGFYYFDQSGYAIVGWYLINGKYYYFDQNGLMQVGFKDIDGKKYYFDPNSGQLVTGWVQIYENGVVDYYYFEQNGEQAIGWKQIDNNWYYFYNGKCLVGTFAKVNDIWYHFNAGGVMDTGWVTERGKMYYFNLSNGALMYGWIQDQNGNEYYLSEVDGSLTVNSTINIAGRSYTFDATGKCIAKDMGNSAFLNNGQSNNYNSFSVNIGISPGNNQIMDAVTSAQKNIANHCLWKLAIRQVQSK